MGWGSIVGSALGAATSLFGVNKSAKSQSAANAANMALAREQMQYQKDLAQNQVQWRVEDAKKAGLHPLAALGISPMSYSPVQGTAVGADYSGLNGVGDSLAQMGQNIDAHIMNAKTKEERQKALRLQDTQTGLALRHQELNNQILEMELASRRAKLFQDLLPGAASTKKGLGVIPGQEGRVSSTIATGDPRYQFMQTPDGTYSLEPGNDWSQIYEDKGPIEIIPIVQTWLRDMAARISGNELDGMVFSDKLRGWVPRDSDDGRAALRYRDAYTRPLKSVGRGVKRLNDFFGQDWLSRLFTTRWR